MFTTHVKRWASRFGFAFMLVVLLGFGLSAMFPTSVRAQGITLEDCTGLSQAGWNPGVTNTPAVHTVSTTSSWLCTGGDLVMNASSVDQFQATFSCIGLLEPVNNIVWIIKWSDQNGPATSTFEFNVTVEAVGGNLVITSNNGKITAGRYAGSSAVTTYTLLGLAGLLNNQCVQPGGLTGAGGVSTLTITIL